MLKLSRDWAVGWRTGQSTASGSEDSAQVPVLPTAGGAHALATALRYKMRGLKEEALAPPRTKLEDSSHAWSCPSLTCRTRRLGVSQTERFALLFQTHPALPLPQHFPHIPPSQPQH